MLHQFIFWLFQKKAVPLHRISNNNLRMKTVSQNLLIRMVLFFFGLVTIVLMFMACSPNPPVSNPPTFEDYISNSGGNSYREFAVADIPSDKLPYILADTVTPPSNPMAPDDLSAFPTYAGTLQIFAADAFNNLNGRYFCGIQLQTPIEIKLSDYETNCYSALYLLDNDSENLVQFDHPLLQSCVVGDTILVTGTPVQISDGIALGIAMRYVQPLHP